MKIKANGITINYQLNGPCATISAATAERRRAAAATRSNS